MNSYITYIFVMFSYIFRKKLLRYKLIFIYSRTFKDFFNYHDIFYNIVNS